MKYEIRSKSGTQVVSLTRKTAIFFFCKECMGWQESEVDLCEAPLCPLFPFRNNKATKYWSERPQRTLTEEQRESLVSKLKRGRKIKSDEKVEQVITPPKKRGRPKKI